MESQSQNQPCLAGHSGRHGHASPPTVVHHERRHSQRKRKAGVQRKAGRTSRALRRYDADADLLYGILRKSLPFDRSGRIRRGRRVGLAGATTSCSLQTLWNRHQRNATSSANTVFGSHHAGRACPGPVSGARVHWFSCYFHPASIPRVSRMFPSVPVKPTLRLTRLTSPPPQFTLRRDGRLNEGPVQAGRGGTVGTSDVFSPIADRCRNAKGHPSFFCRHEMLRRERKKTNSHQEHTLTFRSIL